MTEKVEQYTATLKTYVPYEQAKEHMELLLRLKESGVKVEQEISALAKLMNEILGIEVQSTPTIDFVQKLKNQVAPFHVGQQVVCMWAGTNNAGTVIDPLVTYKRGESVENACIVRFYSKKGQTGYEFSDHEVVPYREIRAIPRREDKNFFNVMAPILEQKLNEGRYEKRVISVQELPDISKRIGIGKTTALVQFAKKHSLTAVVNVEAVEFLRKKSGYEHIYSVLDKTQLSGKAVLIDASVNHELLPDGCTVLTGFQYKNN
jgi:hypothetical protein